MSRRLRVNTALLAVLSLATSSTFAGDLMFTASFDESPEGPYNDYEAARFLTQATFGPTIPEIQRLRRMGYSAWFDEQLGLPFSTHRPYLEGIAATGENVYQNVRNEAFFQRAMTAPDQLRQRLALALSEIFVTSDQGGGLGGEPLALAHYYDLLGQQGLGTYRNLLEQVTLSPIMGRYLSMLQNRKPDAALNIRPDENYAREIMQLFSVGLVQLNMDGTPFDGDPISSGVQSVPSYNQDTIRGFAHVFTGWTFNGCSVSSFNWCGQGEDGSGWYQPLIAPEGPWDSSPYFVWHAYLGNKQLLNYQGVDLPDGTLLGSAERTSASGSPSPYSNLTAALTNVSEHPNVGPFISKLLIQRFVTSNPDADYVTRVATVFNNNGNGTRGDLRAVLIAILMDPDARANPLNGLHQGKLREPLLRMTQLMRAFDAYSPNGRFNDWLIHWPGQVIPQSPLHSPTVFNFFLPDYSPVGEIADAMLAAPEFQILTDAPITLFNDEMWWRLHRHFGSSGGELNFDFRPERSLRNNIPSLLNRLDVLLLSGQMSTHMTATLANYLATVPAEDDGGYRRAREAVWLIMASPEYIVEK